MARLRRGAGLYTVGPHGYPESWWAWLSSPEKATLEALRLAKILVADGKGHVLIHCDSAKFNIMTATANQWLEAEAELNKHGD
jgi:hypothetical protein